MSQFSVPVIRVNQSSKHPQADSLSITSVDGNPVIFRTSDWHEGDLAVYVPVDAVVPLEDVRFSFLSDKVGAKTYRIRAKKLRDIFSMGLLVKPNPHMNEGEDAAKALGITKYEEKQEAHLGGPSRSDPGFCPIYDVENYRKYKNLFEWGEEVVVTEKIHGCNSRFGWHNGEFFVGSHNSFRKPSENVWWKIAKQLDLEAKLKPYPGLILYGEVYGQVQDLQYNTKQGEYRFAAFDIYDTQNNCFFDYDRFVELTDQLAVERVPVLYRGAYQPSTIEPLSEGTSTIAKHIREGFVIRPIQERREHMGRVILKLVGEAYHLRKGGTEHH